MNFNIPTILTLLRIASIPLILVVFYLPIDNARVWCSAIVVIASATDWLDGFLARRLNLQTAFGEFLDPVADKLMVVMILVLIVQADPVAYLAIPAAIIIGREVYVASLREWMAQLGQRSTIEVSWLGKCKTGFQMVAMLCLLFNADLYGLPIRLLGVVLSYVACLLSLWSMWQYIQLAIPKFKK